MSAIAALTIADGQATPVNHAFSPVNIDAAGVARWADRSGGIALGYPVISQSLRAPTKSSRNYKLTLKVAVPTLEVTSPSTSTGIQPAPTLAYSLVGTMEFILPERSSLQERKNLEAYVKNMLANGVFANAIENFESVY
jgi:hypothetical protein